jgi:hypothetical protein
MMTGKYRRAGIAAREPGVAVAAPLHRRADAVAIAEIDVVAHADLVAVVDDRRARHRKEQAVHQLDARSRIVHQRRQPAPDTEVEAHLRVGRVLRVHVVTFLVVTISSVSSSWLRRKIAH